MCRGVPASVLGSLDSRNYDGVDVRVSRHMTMRITHKKKNRKALDCTMRCWHNGIGLMGYAGQLPAGKELSHEDDK